MMSVFARLGPDGPRLEVTSNDVRIGELSTDLAAMGVKHELRFETDYRSRLVIPMQAPGAVQEARS